MCMYFSDIMAAIEWYAEAKELKDSAVFFCSLLAKNQHQAKEDMRSYSFEGDQLVVDSRSLLVTTAATMHCRESCDVGKGVQF